MKKISEIPMASVECLELPDNEGTHKIALARELEAKGHQTIAVGRAIVTIERGDPSEEMMTEIKDCEVLKLSFYSDPDASGETKPVVLYLEGSRWGFRDAYLQVRAPDGRQRVFKLEGKLVRDEF